MSRTLYRPFTDSIATIMLIVPSSQPFAFSTSSIFLATISTSDTSSVFGRRIKLGFAGTITSRSA